MPLPFDAAALGIPASPVLLGAIALIIIVAAIVQVGLGMGFGLTAAPLLALIDPSLVPTPTLFLGMLTSIWVAVGEADGIQWNEVGISVVGRIIGAAAGTAILLVLVDRSAFMVVFGVLIATAVLLSISGWRAPFTRLNLIAMSTASGLMGTITSVGAPPLALIYQSHPPAKARPTLAAFFAVGCAISLTGLFASGWASWNDVLRASLMLPPMLVGLVLARLLKGRFDRRYRPALLAVSGIAAVMLVARGLA